MNSIYRNIMLFGARYGVVGLVAASVTVATFFILRWAVGPRKVKVKVKKETKTETSTDPEAGADGVKVETESEFTYQA